MQTSTASSIHDTLPYLLVYLKKFKDEGRSFRKYQTDVVYDENLVIICKIKLTNETIICIPMAIKEGRLLARKINSEQISIDLNQIIGVEKICV